MPYPGPLCRPDRFPMLCYEDAIELVRHYLERDVAGLREGMVPTFDIPTMEDLLEALEAGSFIADGRVKQVKAHGGGLL